MTNRIYGSVLAYVVIVLLTAGSLCAAQEADRAIDLKAQEIIKDLSKAHQQQGAVRFKVYDTSEEILETGVMVQYGHVRTVVLKRPDRFWMETRGDRSNTTLWYDGSAFTLLDRDKNVYARLQAPGTIDDAIDMAYDRYGINTPLADMLSGDIYSVLMDAVITCRYLGIGRVGEVKCHHIIATQNEIDWQIWIDQGDTPRLRKLVITYKHIKGSPRYTALLAEAEALTSVSPTTFMFEPPAGAAEVEPIPREKDEKSRL